MLRSQNKKEKNLQYLLNCKRMLRLGQNIFANFQLEQPKTQATQQVSILLLGNCGVGKSKLTNNICGSCQQVGIVKRSLTKFLFKGNCQYEKRLNIYDGPGLDSNDERQQNQLLSGLKNYQFNAVAIIAKIDARFGDNTITEITKISKIFKKQMNMIFLISHLDMIDNQKDATLFRFNQALQEYEISGKVILFSNQNSDFKVLSEVLYRCAVGQTKKKLSVEKKKIKNFFRCVQITNQFDQIIEEEKNNPYENFQEIKVKSNENYIITESQKSNLCEKTEEDKQEMNNYNIQLEMQNKKNKNINNNQKKKKQKRFETKFKNDKKSQYNRSANKNQLQQNLFDHRYSSQMINEQYENKKNNNCQSLKKNLWQILIILIVILLMSLAFMFYSQKPENKIYKYQMNDEKNKNRTMIFKYKKDGLHITMEDNQREQS